MFALLLDIVNVETCE